MSMLLAALLMTADPAVAQMPTADAPIPAAAQKEKKICHTDTDADSTSRMRRRVCLTQSEWDKKEGGGVSVNDLKNMGAR